MTDATPQPRLQIRIIRVTPLQQNCRTMLQKLQKDLAPFVQFLQKK